MTSLQNSKNNFLLMMSLFGVLAVGGSALFLNRNVRVNLNSGASNVEQSMENKLVKRGTSAFSPCKELDTKYTYALVGSNDKDVKGKQSPKPSNCTPLVVSSSAAEALVGKLVVVKGTYVSGVFYATSVLDARLPQNSPKGSIRPVVIPTNSPIKFKGTPVPVVPPPAR